MKTNLVLASEMNEVVNEAQVVEMNPVMLQPNSVDELFFADVKKIPAEKIMPDFNFCSYNDHVIQITTKSGKKVIVNNVSSNYLLIPNSELFPRIEEGLHQFGNLKIKREVSNYGAFFTNYIFDDKKYVKEFMKNDILTPRVSIQNSYNSKHLFNVTFGLYRYVCSNGLAIPMIAKSLEVAHCMNNLDKVIESTTESIGIFLNTAKEYIEQFEMLVEKKVDANKLELIVEGVLKATNSLRSYKKEIIERIQKENIKEGIELNLWSIYNGINYMLQPNNNSKMTSAFDVREKMDQKIQNYMFYLAKTNEVA